MEDLTGKQLGSYQVVAPLGEGGMAAVYRAFQPGMERYVALKILPRHFASDPEFVGRFEQEAKVVARLQHPHILPVFDYGRADGYTFIAMPYLQNGDLTDLMRRGTPLSLAEVRRIVSQIGDALDYAHSRGLVHRDVKPSNVLLDERGNCLLSDFGITKIVEDPAHLTATGGLVGTPAYMSPEQGLGRKLDGRSDIYALGIMLYEMVTGRVPYRAETPLAVVVKHIHDPLPLPRQLKPTLPEAVEAVILKALAKQPEDRFATAGDMVRALQAAIPDTLPAQMAVPPETATMLSSASTTQTGDQAAAGTIPGRPGRPTSWFWGLGLAAAAVVGVLVVGIVIFFVTNGPAAVETGGGTAVGRSQAADPALYDDFNDPAFEGGLNPVWSPFDESDESDISQDGGVLTIVRRGEPESAVGLVANRYHEVSIDRPTFFEASFMVEAEQDGHAYLFWGSDLPSEDYTDCTLGYGDEEAASIECGYYIAEETAFWSGSYPADYGTWHQVRIEVDPDPMEFSYFIDGRPAGRYVPPNASELRDEARFYLDIGAWGDSTDAVTVHFDEVRIGPVE